MGPSESINLYYRPWKLRPGVKSMILGHPALFPVFNDTDLNIKVMCCIMRGRRFIMNDDFGLIRYSKEI